MNIYARTTYTYGAGRRLFTTNFLIMVPAVVLGLPKSGRSRMPALHRALQVLGRRRKGFSIATPIALGIGPSWFGGHRNHRRRYSVLRATIWCIIVIRCLIARSQRKSFHDSTDESARPMLVCQLVRRNAMRLRDEGDVQGRRDGREGRGILGVADIERGDPRIHSRGDDGQGSIAYGEPGNLCLPPER